MKHVPQRILKLPKIFPQPLPKVIQPDFPWKASLCTVRFKEVALLEVHKQPAPCPVPPLHTHTLPPGTSALFFFFKKKKERKQLSSLKGGIEFTLAVQQ